MPKTSFIASSHGAVRRPDTVAHALALPARTTRLQLAVATALLAAACAWSGGQAHAQATPADPSGTTPAAAEPTAPAAIQGAPVPPAAAGTPGIATTPPVAAPAPVAPPAPAAKAPRYSAAEVAQMFGYIDRDKDGFLSRDEAAGFRGVARHFDEADLDKDNRLSREEFEKAMSQVR